ncbi:MAG: LamG domain-containing protein [Victivallales bacterium]|jgi:hypothetical protein|nr:LamG domain-containing protein [Victivallales bacterium]
MTKKTTLTVIISATLSLMANAGEIPESLQEHIRFQHSFESLDVDAARGNPTLRNKGSDFSKTATIEGVRGKALYCQADAPRKAILLYETAGNIDFTEPGTLVFYVKNIDSKAISEEVINANGWRKVLLSEFFMTNYAKTGYIVLQRASSALPGRPGILQLAFPLFSGIKASKNIPFDFPLDEWVMVSLKWNGVNFAVAINGKECFALSLQRKLDPTEISNFFSIGIPQGMALDELIIFDKSLSDEELVSLVNGDTAK